MTLGGHIQHPASGINHIQSILYYTALTEYMKENEKGRHVARMEQIKRHL
jgi:hypothetical protein